MFPALVGLLYVPIAVWVATGAGLVLLFRRAAPPVVLRLAATFLALWALLATTTLVWVLDNGGWSAVLRLLHSPGLMFEVRYAYLWLWGAAGAFAVLAGAFTVNQLVGRGFLHLLRPEKMEWPTSLPRPAVRTSLLSFSSSRAQAFSFTLLDFGGVGLGGVHRHEVVLISTGLLERLDPPERVGAIAHELGHVRGLDSRYLTFLRTFARLMRWDPVLAVITGVLTRREEFRADAAAVEMTHDPLALARAIYKVSRGASSVGRFPAYGPDGFLGASGARGRREAVERIRRLVEMAESGSLPEAPDG